MASSSAHVAESLDLLVLQLAREQVHKQRHKECPEALGSAPGAAARPHPHSSQTTNCSPHASAASRPSPARSHSPAIASPACGRRGWLPRRGVGRRARVTPGPCRLHQAGMQVHRQRQTRTKLRGTVALMCRPLCLSQTASQTNKRGQAREAKQERPGAVQASEAVPDRQTDRRSVVNQPRESS